MLASDEDDRLAQMAKDDMPIYRLYFDGLIAHFQLPWESSTLSLMTWVQLVSGTEQRMTFGTVTFEHSI